jgi:hypothetical protein
MPKTKVVLRSGSRKMVGTGERTRPARPVAVTSRSMDTCPTSCIHMGAGNIPECYANVPTNASGTTHFSRVEEGKGFTFSGDDNAKDAMQLLRVSVPPRGTVRHLESGDVDIDYINHVNNLAAKRPYNPKDPSNTGIRMWGYTHRWRDLDPSMVKGWTLLASVETEGEAKEALSRGWKVAITSPKSDTYAGGSIDGHKVMPCPQQELHGKVGCETCNLCYEQGSEERPSKVVEFQIHSSKARLASQKVVDKRAAEQAQQGRVQIPLRVLNSDHFKFGVGDG